MSHHPNCDVNDFNLEGIKKPCNCGTLKELKETIDSAISFVEIQPMFPMSEAEIADYKRRFGDFDLIIGDFGVKRIIHGL